MVDKTIFMPEELDNIPLYKLRLILRDLGGTPGSKNIREIKQEIIDIQSGKVIPSHNNRGRKPKTSADYVKPVQSQEESQRADFSTNDEEPSNVYQSGDVYIPFSYQVTDNDVEPGSRMVVAEGILNFMPEGYGFLRTYRYGEPRRQFHVDKQIIKAYGLKPGDYIVGYAIKRDKPTLSLCEVAKINGIDIDAFVRGVNFEERTAIYPTESLISPEECDKTMRAIDLIAPIAKGQRGLIVAPPKTGKTTLLKKIANSIIEYNEKIKVIILLIDERPEEVSDFAQSLLSAEVVASTFDESPEKHVKFAEMAVERAKRLVESGRDVVILLDSITKLARAYNNVIPASGKTLSGGIDAQALVQAKKLFGSARNLKEGGSLTVIATALTETGSRMDDIIYEEFKGTGNMEIILSRELAQKRVFPAIDILRSGTRKEELILPEEKIEAMYKFRSSLSSKNNVSEIFLEMIKQSNNNIEFVKKLPIWIKSILS